MKRKLSIFLCMILAAALFTALSGSVLAAGTDISATVGNRVALRLDTASDAVLTGASVVEGELPEGLQVSASGGKLLLSGTPVKAGYHRAVVRPVPGGYADEQILRINVRPGEMEPARGEELFNGTTETVPETTAAPDPTSAPAPAGPNITKHPGREAISANGSAIFVARAEDVAEYTWYIVAPRGVAYLSDQVKTVFPDMGIAGEKGNGIILYNIPSRCVVNMTSETTLRLAHDCENIVAIKEASGDIEQVGRIVDGRPEGFAVYSGDDSFTYKLMKRGGEGVISTIGNVAPARMKEIVELCAAGEWEAAAEKNEALLPLMEGLFATTNPILVKQALALLDFPVGGVRLPLVDATAEQTEALAEVMRSVGVL